MKPIIPMLDEIELKAIQEISTTEVHAFIEHKIPGMDGSVFQNLGRKPTKVMFSGILCGEKAKEDLEKLWIKFKAGEPVSFVANITTATDVSQVLIEELKVNEVAGKPDYFRYSAALKECPSPPPDEDKIEEEQKQEAQKIKEKKEKQVEQGVSTLEVKVDLEKEEIDYSNVRVIVTDKATGGADFKIIMEKHENGVFTMDEFPLGDYDVTVEKEFPTQKGV